jgi:hypothetical protein
MTGSFSTIRLFTKTKVCTWPMESVFVIVHLVKFHASLVHCFELTRLIFFRSRV